MIRILLLPLSIIAIILAQLVGHSDSCTQGSGDGWLAGAAVSMPFIIIIAIFTVATIAFGPGRRRRLELIAFAVVALGAAGLLLVNAGLLHRILLLGLTACEPDYGPATREDMTVAVVYGLLPFITMLLSLIALRRSWSAPAKSQS